jgi:hypothetical protein
MLTHLKFDQSSSLRKSFDCMHARGAVFAVGVFDSIILTALRKGLGWFRLSPALSVLLALGSGLSSC